MSKERAILDVAMRLFSQYGYKRTSVDDIALGAGIAKGTIYVYFESKEALFRALCTTIVERMYAEVERATTGDAPAIIRIETALRTKFGRLFRMVMSTPHGREMVESRDAVAADIFKAFDRKFEALLVGIIESGLARNEISRTDAALNAKSIAQTLIAASRGLAAAARDVGDFDRRFEALLAVVQTGLRR